MIRLALPLTALILIAAPAAARPAPKPTPAQKSVPAPMPTPAPATTAKGGPKVHTAQAVDTSDCMKIASKKSGLGGLIGGLAGLVTKDSTVALVGAAAGAVATDKIDRKAGCAPKATIVGEEAGKPAAGKRK